MRMMSYQRENINKELDQIEILEFKSIIIKMRHSLKGLSEKAERVSNLIG